MSDWPKALRKEGEALERGGTWAERMAARAALIAKIRELLDAALAYERISYSAIPEKVDALLSEEDV